MTPLGLTRRKTCYDKRVMTEKALRNLKANKAQYLVWISEIDRVTREIAVKGTASASLSAGSGSKSYTRIDLGTLRELRSDYCGRVLAIRRRLAGCNSTGIRQVMTVRG